MTFKIIFGIIGSTAQAVPLSDIVTTGEDPVQRTAMELFITFLAGASVLVGALLIRISKHAHRVEHLSMAMALTALISLLAADLGPEMVEAVGEKPMLTIAMMLAGLAVLIILDRFVPDHEDSEEKHDAENAAHVGIISALALFVHNIVEGMTIYSVLCSDLKSGVIFSMGVALHNIPVGMMIYSALSSAGRKQKAAVSIVVTLSTAVGGLLMAALSGLVTETVTSCLVAVATGMILYIVFFELLPHVIKEKDRLMSLAGAVLGVGAVLLSTLLE